MALFFGPAGCSISSIRVHKHLQRSLYRANHNDNYRAFFFFSFQGAGGRERKWDRRSGAQREEKVAFQVILGQRERKRPCAYDWTSRAMSCLRRPAPSCADPQISNRNWSGGQLLRFSPQQHWRAHLSPLSFFLLLPTRFWIESTPSRLALQRLGGWSSHRTLRTHKQTNTFGEYCDLVSLYYANLKAETLSATRVKWCVSCWFTGKKTKILKANGIFFSDSMGKRGEKDQEPFEKENLRSRNCIRAHRVSSSYNAMEKGDEKMVRFIIRRWGTLNESNRGRAGRKRNKYYNSLHFFSPLLPSDPLGAWLIGFPPSISYSDQELWKESLPLPFLFFFFFSFCFHTLITRPSATF